jgi:hypothetical protein
VSFPGAPAPRPRRQVVAHPRTAAALSGRPQQRQTAARELSEQTDVGQMLVRGLVRAQLLLALRLFAAVACPLGGLPLLLAAAPGLGDLRVLGVPLPWLVLGVAVYPVFVAVGWLHIRLAERNERAFVEAVERS